MPRVENRYMRVLHELEGIAVAGHDHDVLSRVAGPGGERREHVVGLVTLQVEARDAEGVENIADHRELRREQIGDRVPVGLVLGDDVVSEGPLGTVPRDRDPARVMGLKEVDQHAHETVNGVGYRPVGRAQIGGYGEESPKDERVAVEQVKPSPA